MFVLGRRACCWLPLEKVQVLSCVGQVLLGQKNNFKALVIVCSLKSQEILLFLNPEAMRLIGVTKGGGLYSS